MGERDRKPKLRFRGFIEDWEERKVKELFKITRGYVLSSTIVREVKTDEMPYPVFSSQTKDNGLMGYYKDFLYENAITWTTDGANAGTVNYRAGKFYCTNVCGVLLEDKAKPNQMISETLNNISGGYVSYVGNPKLMNNVMAEIEINLPLREDEQNKISDFFYQLDSLITTQQQKYDKLISIKKSMLEKMFPKEHSNVPEIRFKGFTDNWKERKLGDITNRVVRKNINNESSLPLTISAEYGLINQFDYFNNRVASRDISNYYLVLNGEFAYNKSTSDGFPFGVIKRLDLYEKGVLSTLYIVFAIKNKQEINSDFLSVFFDTDRWHKEIAECAAEGARNHGLLNISVDDFFNIKIFNPIKECEQSQIGSFFHQLDHLITLHKRKLEKLKSIKKSCLEKMFV